jgi:hypothetical protein
MSDSLVLIQTYKNLDKKAEDYVLELNRMLNIFVENKINIFNICKVINEQKVNDEGLEKGKFLLFDVDKYHNILDTKYKWLLNCPQGEYILEPFVFYS